MMEGGNTSHVRDEVVVETEDNQAPNTSVPVGDTTTNTSAPNLMPGFPTDPFQLQAMLMQSLLSSQTQQQQVQKMQKKNQELLAQLVTNSRRPNEKKLTNCPKKRTETSLESWISEVKMWNDANKETNSFAQKYLFFIESVRSSDGCEDLKKFVEVNIVENKNLKKEEEDSIAKIVQLIEENLGKSDLEKSTGHWISFSDLKQESGESVKDFVTRFEQVETGLRNSQIILPSKALAIHLLTKSTLSESSKENILAKVNTDDHEKLYSAVVKTMRELKTLTTTHTGQENHTFYGNHRRGSSASGYHSSRNNFQKDSFRQNYSKDRRYSRSKSRAESNRNSSGRNERYGDKDERNNRGRRHENQSRDMKSSGGNERYEDKVDRNNKDEMLRTEAETETKAGETAETTTENVVR